MTNALSSNSPAFVHLPESTIPLTAQELEQLVIPAEQSLHSFFEAIDQNSTRHMGLISEDKRTATLLMWLVKASAYKLGDDLSDQDVATFTGIFFDLADEIVKSALSDAKKGNFDFNFDLYVTTLPLFYPLVQKINTKHPVFSQESNIMGRWDTINKSAAEYCTILLRRG